MIDSDPTNKRLEVQKYAVPSPDYSFRFGNVIKYDIDADVHLCKVREMGADPLLQKLIDAYDADFPIVQA